jgi:hypothetical protein
MLLRHYELAHLLSNIEKLPLPILGSMSLSGTQPEFSFGRLHAHVDKDILSLFLASSQFNVQKGVNEGEATPGPDLARVHSGRSGPTDALAGPVVGPKGH